MHPEDIKMEREGRAIGRQFAAAFCVKRMVKLVELISTYPDTEAAELLVKLRTEFWSTDWKSKRR